VRNIAGIVNLVLQKRGDFNWDDGLRRLCSCGRIYEQLAGRIGYGGAPWEVEIGRGLANELYLGIT
jgi:hypothetical protein